MSDLLTWNGERGERGGEILARVRRSHLDHGSPQWEWTCVVGDCVWRGALSEADGQAAAEAAVRDWFTRIGVVVADGSGTDVLNAALADDGTRVRAIVDRMPIVDLEALFDMCRCITWHIRCTQAWADTYGTKTGADRG